MLPDTAAFLSTDSFRNVPKSAERIRPEFNQRCTLWREEKFTALRINNLGADGNQAADLDPTP
jgi:hypothetical protein